MNKFIIYPALDLRHGKVVRLKEGDPNRQTQYSDDPVVVAERWLEAGAHWLHIVNLDGAFGETDQLNQQAVVSILKRANPYGVPVQLGGGMRSLEAVERALKLGVSRVMIGTMAIEHPQLLEKALVTWSMERVGVSIDARVGLVTVRGWQNSTGVEALALAKDLRAKGLSWLVFTDVARDGMQTGLNIEKTCQIALETGLNVIASGGVAGWGDIISARNAGLAGVIVGRALYEGVFDPQKLFMDGQAC